MTTDDGRRMTAGNFYRSGVVAKVKWFDPAKGFGFVTPDDGSPDAFLHASLLKPLGRESVPEGAVLSCDINKGTKGPQVALIHSLEEPPPPARAGNRGPGGRRTGRVGGASGQSAKPTAPRGSLAVAVPPVAATGRQAPGHSKPVEGTVKFFDPRKGFGFLVPERGGKDIYIGADALRRSGIEALQPNVRLRVFTRDSERGIEAERVEFP